MRKDPIGRNRIVQTYRMKSASAEQTEALGAALGERLQNGDVVLLKGDLGAGKTCFSKGVAKGLGITSDVVSPTFNIVIQYDGGRIPLYHFDLYRLEDSQELEDVDFYYLVDCDTSGASLIEWADLFLDEMPDERIEVNISKSDDGTREIEITSIGEDR